MTGEDSSYEQQRTSLAEKLWLAYFNQYLYEEGMITESQRNKIKLKIDSRKASSSKAKSPREGPEL